MPLSQKFYFFMAAVGVFAGFVLARSPEAGEFAVKPIIWLLIAVAGFDAVSYFQGAAKTGGMLRFNARILGFTIGLIWMMLIPYLAGTQVRII